MCGGLAGARTSVQGWGSLRSSAGVATRASHRRDRAGQRDHPALMTASGVFRTGNGPARTRRGDLTRPQLFLKKILDLVLVQLNGTRPYANSFLNHDLNDLITTKENDRRGADLDRFLLRLCRECRCSKDLRCSGSLAGVQSGILRVEPGRVLALGPAGCRRSSRVATTSPSPAT